MDNILITICARGGSKGIPGKNIKKVNGRPLLCWTADIAKLVAAKHNADIILSTDSDAIREVGKTCGLDTDYKRPEILANDTCGKPAAIRDALYWAESNFNKRYDYIIDLDVTSPIRTLEDIENCLNRIKENTDAQTIFSVNPCARNPYFNMVEESGDGYAHVVLGGKYTSRQTAPKVYDMNASIYIYRRAALEKPNPSAVTDKSLAYVMDHICFDLDEPLDYDYLSYLLDSGKIVIG